MVYSIEYKGPFVAAPDEIDELRWYTLSEVDEWVKSAGGSQQDMTTGFIEIWVRYRNLSV